VEEDASEDASAATGALESQAEVTPAAKVEGLEEITVAAAAAAACLLG